MDEDCFGLLFSGIQIANSNQGIFASICFMFFWFMFLALVVGTSSFLLVDGEFSVGVLSSAMTTFEKNEVMLGVRSIAITKILGEGRVDKPL